MGCGSSKNQIHVASTALPIDNTKNDKTVETKPPRGTSSRPNSKTVESRNKSAGGRSKRSAWGGSTDSLRDDISLNSGMRGGSASSKVSKHSGDSGFDDPELGAKVITEASDPDRVREVEDTFDTPRELELGVVGQACPQRLSAKDKERLQEQRVMASLQQEGLIARPMSRAAFGVSFEVVQVDTDNITHKRPPARLAKLEKRRKKKDLTEEELMAKQARAEERRKRREQERIAKIQAVTMKSDVMNALDSFAARQETVKTEVQAKEEQVLENREKKLKEMRDKIRAKQEHAEMVRKRRALAPTTLNEEENQLLKSRNFTEDTPIGSQ